MGDFSLGLFVFLHNPQIGLEEFFFDFRDVFFVFGTTTGAKECFKTFFKALLYRKLSTVYQVFKELLDDIALLCQRTKPSNRDAVKLKDLPTIDDRSLTIPTLRLKLLKVLGKITKNKLSKIFQFFIYIAKLSINYISIRHYSFIRCFFVFEIG